MTLVDLMMEDAILMNKSKTPDGEGGFVVTWTEGAEISCAIVNNTSIQAKIAEKEGVTSTYTITAKKSVPIEFHDVIKRVSDGKIFRITSDAGDKESPMASTLDMAQYSAEKWSL